MSKVQTTKIQMKMEPVYYERLKAFCDRNGATYSDVFRYMLDTLQLNEIDDGEFDDWYNARYNRT